MLLQLGRAFSYGFLMNQKREGVIISGELAGQRSGRKGRHYGLVYNYSVREANTGAIINVNHVGEARQTGDSVIVYTYPGGKEGHFKTGFEAFVSHDIDANGSQGILTAASAIFVLPSALLLVAIFRNKVF